MINGTTPNHYCAFASCDPIYLRDHAPALTASCAVNEQPLHLHVVNPFKKDLALLGKNGRDYAEQYFEFNKSMDRLSQMLG